MRYLLGLDVGTTGAKALLIDQAGKPVADGTCEYPLLTPRAGWAEQHPQQWWEATARAISAVVSQSSLPPGDIAAVGLTGQMHGSVFLDDEDQVIRPAILWCDQRTAEQCRWITDTVGAETIVAETCNPVLTGFQAPKIIWMRDHEPQNYARLARVLLPKDYIRLKLTDEYATDVSDASGTSLLNVPRRQWSQAMLDGLQLDERLLPRVYESPEVTGRITPEAAAATGLAVGTPVIAGAGDQAAGGVGNGVVASGSVSVTTGTSGVVFAYLDQPITDSQLRTHTFCHAVPGSWHVMGVMLAAGGSLRWLRDALCAAETALAADMGVDPYELMTAQAAKVAPGADGLLFLPYLTGERCPYADPDARGVFFGLNLTHGKPHLIRAVLEGVTYGLRDCFELIRNMGVQFSSVRLSGGGARSDLWRHIQADILRHEVCTVVGDHGAAYGAALLAAVAAGVYPTVRDAVDATISTVHTVTPDPTHSDVYDGYYAAYRRLYGALRAEFTSLAELM